ncbi:MAG TPA: L,D-transpeptidase family protein [Allosphingosinicella sp.]|nr:L,D-transpeptidase family protein [Allosphingosinicella sp.]
MNQVSVRNLFVAGSVLLLAFTPICSAYAEVVGPAAAAVEPAPAAVETAVLKPGEFVWQPERSPAGEVEMVVSIPLQRAYVYRGGILIAVTTVSTGKPGHRTPTGKFDILEKRARHFSNLYNNAPMPFMQRLTWGGIALHAGQIPGRPASHGCVRLPLAFARNLFGVTSKGGAVHIVDKSPAPTEALAMVKGHSVYAGMGGPLEEVPAGTD